MNVFEDLVVELKEENLLEKTVIDVQQAEGADEDIFEVTGAPKEVCDSLEAGDQTEQESANEESSLENEEETEDLESETVELISDDDDTGSRAEQSEKPIKVKNGKEFFKKRAVAEVSSLQMVEHVLTGVEREYMKIVPNAFDDFNVKKALHAFLHVTENVNSGEHAEAEFKLMHETEAWCTALADRDRNVPVSSLRQSCENSRPALSSQALLALARFYRNLPYSESVRSKFDFVITRLFSRPVEHDKRASLFGRDEALGHINTLYKEWSSVPLYTAEDDESKVLLTALSFEDLAVESENASNFDQLIESDFFGRLRLFKESISELFFAPNVTAAAIEANVRIGNAYVDLIGRERQKMDAESIQSKYGDLHDGAVSDAAARTLELVELLRERPEVKDDQVEGEDEQTDESAPDPPKIQKTKAAKKRWPFLARITDNALSVNKWFIGTAIVLIAASVGVYVWANFIVVEQVSTAGVEPINIENSVLKEHVKTARLSNETFYGQLQPSWDALPKEKRQEFLQKVFQACREKGCKQVSLITKDGKAAGYASATRLDVVMP